MRVRPAGIEDLAGLLLLERDVFAAAGWSERSWLAELNVPGRHVVVADEDGRVQGCGVLMETVDSAEVLRVGVRASRRRRGIGRALLAELLAEAGRRRADRVVLEVEATNTAALGLYHGAGFRELARRHAYYGTGRDAVVMARTVGGPGLLRASRLLLRRLAATDLALLVELHCDSRVMRHIDAGPVTEPDVARLDLPRMLAANRRGLGYWVAADPTGADIGWFGLGPSDHGAEASLGYRLLPRAWGRGFATEGGGALVDYGFRTLGLERITATTMTVNAGSRRVLEKLGFRLVRTFFEDWTVPLPGSEHGDMEYEVRR